MMVANAFTSLPVLAQGAPAPTVGVPATTFTAPNVDRTGGVILPTDVLPLPTIQNRMTFGENFQLRLLQRLPARFYFNSSTEASFRYETNPFQFPKKRDFNRQLPPPQIQAQLSPADQQRIRNVLKLVNSEDIVFRILPNVTAGFTLAPHTRVFANYFMIRDSLFKNIRLNTVIHSIAYGIQQDIPLSSRANLQAEMQFRELYQTHQQAVFDFLPGLTLSYVVTPRTVAFANVLLQMRGRRYFQSPNKELDPFYTIGMLHQRGGWSFSASSTFVQNFRDPFHRPTIPVNNYAMISDFEIARRLFRQLPGLQAFVRAEPIWNMQAHNRPGLSGMDFRLFWGLRLAVAKPALTGALDSLRKQLEEQEISPPTPVKPSKPSAFLEPQEVTASLRPQPIHGFLSDSPIRTASGSSENSLLSIHNEVDETDNSAAAQTVPIAMRGPIILNTPASASQQLRNREAADVPMFVHQDTEEVRMYIHNAVGQVQ